MPPPAAEGTAAGGGGAAPMGSGYGSDSEVYGGAGSAGGGALASVRGHSVVELSFTSSVRFLQPGLLLQVGGAWNQPPPSLGHRVRLRYCEVRCSLPLPFVLLGVAAIP